MSKNKGHNSILFLTTLSVYLGLVLVGASPTVLAQQAALTQRLEIQNEVDVDEDLDKLPEKFDGLSEDIQIIKNLKIAEAIDDFLSNLRKLESIGKFDPQTDWIFSHKLWSEYFDGTYSHSLNSDVGNPWLATAINELIRKAESENLSSVSDNLPNCEGYNCREIVITVESTASDFTLSFTFTKQNTETAKNAAEAFSEIFLSNKVALKDTKNLSIDENTKVFCENNQVLIVTRLPRGSLDELVKAKGQAN